MWLPSSIITSSTGPLTSRASRSASAAGPMRAWFGLLHEKARLGQWMATVPPPPALDPGSAEAGEIAAANKPARVPRAPAAPATSRPAGAA